MYPSEYCSAAESHGKVGSFESFETQSARKYLLGEELLRHCEHSDFVLTGAVKYANSGFSLTAPMEGKMRPIALEKLVNNHKSINCALSLLNNVRTLNGITSRCHRAAITRIARQNYGRQAAAGQA
jgi:hypothetical protein